MRKRRYTMLVLWYNNDNFVQLANEMLLLTGSSGNRTRRIRRFGDWSIVCLFNEVVIIVTIAPTLYHFSSTFRFWQAARETGHGGAGAVEIVRGIFRDKGPLGFFQVWGGVGGEPFWQLWCVTGNDDDKGMDFDWNNDDNIFRTSAWRL